MTEAEKLHQRKMQLKNEIVKPLLALMDRGLDVPGILQDLAREAQAGNDRGEFKTGTEQGQTGKQKKGA